MRLVLFGANAFAALFSLVWMWGHTSSPAGDWEFWFALGYLALTVGNVAYFLTREQRSSGRYREED